MRALVITDIHGNLPALEAVLAAAASPAVGGFDELWNLGDMVGYGAQPNQVLDLLIHTPTLRTLHVRGNHDRVCCGLTSPQGFNPIAAAAALWTKDHLTPDHLAWLRAVPQGPVRATARAMCAHGSPLHEDQYIVSMRDAWTPLQRMESAITFFGHTHVQGSFSRHDMEWDEERPAFLSAYETRSSDGLAECVIEVPVDSRQLINPGSVGQPRDGDWRAAFALYDNLAEDSSEGPQERVTFYRVPYDVAATQAAIRAAGLPERLATRLTMGR
jgi:diadenosine tetraphosphatase ApaH/serine/threonine PP2A family protein phosphatase